MGLGIGAVLEIVANAPGKPIIVFARGARLALSRKLASEIMGIKNETH
jgi:Fe2+ transport system protein FeoA